MDPYTHLVIASKLEALVAPASKQEYYWGAIAPDVRYLAAMSRCKTHLSSQQIIELISTSPHLKSFLQGLLVHCLIDDLDLRPIFFRRFPFSALKRQLSPPRLAGILEFYNLENESICPRISGTYNEVLSAWGVGTNISNEYASAIRRYAAPSSLESRLSDLLKLTGLENKGRIGKYISAAELLHKYRILKKCVSLTMKAGRINEQVVSMLASRYRQYGLS